VRINKKIMAVSSSVAFIAAMGASAFASPVPVNQTVGQVNILSGSGGGDNVATIEMYAFEHATGNVGANIASGDNNQQANSAYIDAGTTTYNYTGSFSQGTLGAAAVFAEGNHATVKDNAFTAATGNIGANVASGAQNMQNNALAVLENVANVTDNTSQAQAFTLTIDSGENNAKVMDNAFEYASGNIGLNVASGSLNQQSNSAVVMTSTNDSDLNSISSSIGQLSAVTLNAFAGGNIAAFTDNAFRYAKGNIGANLASGTGNQQANVLVVEP